LKKALADPELNEEGREMLRGAFDAKRGAEAAESESFEKVRLEFQSELEEMQERFQEDLRRLEEKMK
jgi:hypothetical protein